MNVHCTKESPTTQRNVVSTFKITEIVGKVQQSLWAVQPLVWGKWGQLKGGGGIARGRQWPTLQNTRLFGLLGGKCR